MTDDRDPAPYTDTQDDDVEVYALENEDELTAKKRQLDLVFWVLLGAAGLVALAIFYLLFQQLSGGGSGQPSPTTSPPVAGDGSWQAVQSRGTLIVGTSLDYPPFSYRNEQFQPDGFDVALIREIANRLGVSVEFRDMAFDGLAGALEINQIDTAIAAISVTPEREQVVDFSNIYFISEDGVLVGAQSTITSVQSAQQMAGQRIGVQRGSVYESWVQANVVDTGLTAPTNLFLYETADAAVRDLTQNRVDLVMLDLQPAQAAVSQMAVRLVGQGINQQRLAIAVPNGADALRIEINAALTQLQNEGRVAQLVQQYIGTPPEQIIPPPTPTATPVVPPTATPLPIGSPTPIPCINGMRYVADLNYNDNNMTTPPPVPPGQPFSKGWRIQNSGNCTWNQTFRLAFVSGNVPGASMGGQPTAIQGQVAPGQTYDIFVNLVAPLQPGVYQGIWQMMDTQGVPFGDRIWVGITVPAPATSTPRATATLSPNIQFTVNSNNIQQGQCVTFSWNVTNSAAVYFYAQGQDWRTQSVPPVSTRQECLQNTTVYFLRVVAPNGVVEERQITVNVTAAPNAPTINQFVANPPQITLGQCVNLQWNVSGNVTRVTVSGNGVVLWDSAPSAGNIQDCPAVIGNVQYSMQAQGPGGTSQAQDYVNVANPSTVVPPTAVPPANPIIDFFNVAPTQITAGECVQISWSTSGATWLVRLLRNNVLVLDDAGLSGTAQDCLPGAGTVTFELVASTAGGQMTTATQTVLVSEVPVSNPLAGKTYFLTTLNSTAVLPNTQINASFNTDGTMSGSGGCNTYGARYVVENTNISITGQTNTNIFCEQPPGVGEQETAYWQALAFARTFEMPDASTLIMRNANGQEILRYSLQ